MNKLGLAGLVVALAVLSGCSKGACEGSDGSYCTNELKSMECSAKFIAGKTCQDLGYGYCNGGGGQSTCRKKPGP